MDLSLIQTHIDNFVDTWEGWTKVFTALPEVFNTAADVYFGLSSDEYEIADAFTNTSTALGSSK